MKLPFRNLFAAKPAPSGAVAPAVEGRIVSIETSVFGRTNDFQRYNPDDLVGRKGLAIYGQMRNDEQVKAVCTFKRDAIVSRGWTFEFEGESPLAEEEKALRKCVIERAVCKTRGSFVDALNVISTGREFGYSLTEKAYRSFEHEGKTWMGIEQFLGRDPSTFVFITDMFGTLLRCEQLAGGRRIEIDLAKFVHYVHSPEFDRYFGRSDLRAAYRAWYFKDTLIKYWGMYLEKMGGGFVVAKVSDGGPQPGSSAYRDLQSVVSQAKAAASLVLPPGVDVEVIFPQHSDSFEKACTWHDMSIAKALLVPNLLGVSHTGETGSYSQAQTQLEAFAWTLAADSQRLEATLNEQVFADLGAQNWGDDEYPQFKLKPVSEARLQWMVTTFKELIGAKALIPTREDEKRLREILGMPPREDDTELLVDPVEEVQKKQDAQELKTLRGQVAAQGNGNAPQPDAKGEPVQPDAKKFAYDESQHPRDGNGRWTADGMSEALTDHVERQMDALAAKGAKRDKVTLTKALTLIKENKSGDERVKAAVKSEASRILRLIEEGKFDGSAFFSRATAAARASFRQALLRGLERVNFSVIAQRQNTLAAQLTADVAAQVARSVVKLLGDSKQLAQLIDTDVSDIATLTLSGAEVGRLQRLFQRGLAGGWSIGTQMANDEMQRAKGAKFAARVARFTDIRDRAAQFFETNSFRMAGNVADATRSVIQQELQNAVKFGKSPKQAREDIWARLAGKGLVSKQAIRDNEPAWDEVGAVLDALDLGSEVTAAHYLDTLARTNLFEAMNEARYAEFTDPELSDFVLALRYSAILDDRTTEICQSLHDSIFKADSPLWDEYRPPNHYNCRSVLVPVTAVDGWDGEESPEPMVEPQEGFK